MLQYNNNNKMSSSQKSELYVSGSKSAKSQELSSSIESNLGIWESLQKESRDFQNEINKYKESKQDECEFKNSPLCEYLEGMLLKYLLPALEESLLMAVKNDALINRSPYHPLDFIVEKLWKINPKRNGADVENLDLFSIPWVKEYLEENPRPYYPLSWLMSDEYAALKIQSVVRGYFVRKRPDVQEMREFWKVIRQENQESELNKLE